MTGRETADELERAALAAGMVDVRVAPGPGTTWVCEWRVPGDDVIWTGQRDDEYPVTVANSLNDDEDAVMVFQTAAAAIAASKAT